MAEKKHSEWKHIGVSPIGDDLYLKISESFKNPSDPEQVSVILLINPKCSNDCLGEQGWASSILHNSYDCSKDGDEYYASWEWAKYAKPFGEGKVIYKRNRSANPELMRLSRGSSSVVVRAWACAHLPVAP